MSAENWQSWMALLPCERCGWQSEDCWCRAGVPASAPPPPPRRKQETPPPQAPRILTLAERRAAYDIPISEVITAVVAERKDDRKEGAA